MRRLRALLAPLALVAALAAALPAAAAHRESDKLPPIRVRDLNFGDVLFYYFQGPDKDLDAITRIEAYEHWGLLPHHRPEADLLLGSLYLDLGLHNAAGAIFAKLLTPDVPPGVRNRAWFYLAEVWYERGYLEKAQQALARVAGHLPPQLEAERTHLLANVLIRLGRDADAVRLLDHWQGPPDWQPYARFNLGIALIREHRLADADRALGAVGTLTTRDSELAALRDRANLAIGYAHLQANDPAAARPALERVRLEGPYSNRALLGMGWADADLGNYRDALVPWLELQRRSLVDAAVQESYLAVPYAYGKLGAEKEAASSYEGALASYAAEGRALDAAIVRVDSGELLSGILAGNAGAARYGWDQQLKTLPNAPESRYLYDVLAGDDFQAGLANYRELGAMQHTLAEWSNSMDAFGDMIDARERAYAVRLPRADRLLGSGALDRMQRRRDDLASRLERIVREHDVAALGSPDQRAKWQRIRAIEAQLAGAAHDAATDGLRDRLRLVKGVLYFEMDAAFNARVWRERRTLKDLDLALHEAEERWIRVERARRSVPTNTGEFASRVAGLEARIDALQTRLAATRRKQGDYLARLADGELSAQKQRLAAYRVQARFELASLYDRAANRDEQTAAPAPAQKEPPR
jgi:tetratricopeptide (TPR) repeat protein